MIEKSELKVSSILKLNNFLFSLTTLQTERIYVETHNFIFDMTSTSVQCTRIQFSELIDDGKNYFFTTNIMEKKFRSSSLFFGSHFYITNTYDSVNSTLIRIKNNAFLVFKTLVN